MAQPPVKQNAKTPAEIFEKLRLPTAVWWLREAVAIVFSVAIITHLFFFNVVHYVGEKFPITGPFVQYVPLYILGITALLWVSFGARGILSALFVLAYPFVLVLGRLPKLAWRNWPMFIIFLPAIHPFFVTFKWRFFFGIGALTSGIIVYASSNRWAVLASALFLAAFLAIHYARRLRAAFAQSTVFGDMASGIQDFWRFVVESKAYRPPEGLEPGSAEYKAKAGENLIFLYGTSTVLYAVAKKMRELQLSHRLNIYLLLLILYTFALTVVVFAFIYLGLEKLYPGSFEGTSTDSSSFLAFSFQTLITAETQMRAVGQVAQLVSNVELFGSLVILILFVFLVLTLIRERYNQDLDQVVTHIGNVSAEVGEFLESNYDVTLAGAEALLFRVNPLVAKWLLHLRYGATRALEMSKEFDAEIGLADEDNTELLSSPTKGTEEN